MQVIVCYVIGKKEDLPVGNEIQVEIQQFDGICARNYITDIFSQNTWGALYILLPLSVYLFVEEHFFRACLVDASRTV